MGNVLRIAFFLAIAQRRPTKDPAAITSRGSLSFHFAFRETTTKTKSQPDARNNHHHHHHHHHPKKIPLVFIWMGRHPAPDGLHLGPADPSSKDPRPWKRNQ